MSFQNLKPEEIRITRTRFRGSTRRLIHSGETITLDYTKRPTHYLIVQDAFVDSPVRYKRADEPTCQTTEGPFAA